MVGAGGHVWGSNELIDREALRATLFLRPRVANLSKISSPRPLCPAWPAAGTELHGIFELGSRLTERGLASDSLLMSGYLALSLDSYQEQSLSS
jgi:hypothetical protein